jgi:hypothetical protein
MSSCELVAFVNTLACVIAKCTPKDDLPLLTSVLGQLAATLATITIQEELLLGTNNVAPIEVPNSNILNTLPRL